MVNVPAWLKPVQFQSQSITRLFRAFLRFRFFRFLLFACCLRAFVERNSREEWNARRYSCGMCRCHRECMKRTQRNVIRHTCVTSVNDLSSREPLYLNSSVIMVRSADSRMVSTAFLSFHLFVSRWNRLKSDNPCVWSELIQLLSSRRLCGFFF